MLSFVRITLCILFISIFAVGFVWGGESSSNEAAMDLLTAMRADQMAIAGATAMTDTMIQSNPSLLPYRDVILLWASKVFIWEAMAPKMAALYKEAFTDQEMHQMASFYRSATGQKLLDKQADLMHKSMAIGTSLARDHENELRQMIAARAKTLNEVQQKDK